MKAPAAFTLIEILVTVVLVGIMAGVSVFMVVTPSREDAQESTNTANTRVLQNQIEAYRAANGGYPSTLDVLVTTDPPYVRDIPGGVAAWNYAADTGAISKAE